MPPPLSRRRVYAYATIISLIRRAFIFRAYFILPLCFDISPLIALEPLMPDTYVADAADFAACFR